MRHSNSTIFAPLGAKNLIDISMKALSFSAPIFILLAALILCGCESLEDRTVEQFSRLSRESELATTSYTVRKVIKANDLPDWKKGKIGARKILFECKATLTAGINLKDLDRSDALIDEKDKSIVLTLPKAELLELSIRPDDIQKVYEEVGLLRSDFSVEDKNRLLQQGEASIRSSLSDYGILSDAQENARQFFTALLSSIGYQHITIKFE